MHMTISGLPLRHRVPGLSLSDAVLSVDALIGYIKHCQVSWVVLNACWSDALINKLLLATSADLLVVTGSVLDRMHGVLRGLWPTS